MGAVSIVRLVYFRIKESHFSALSLLCTVSRSLSLSVNTVTEIDFIGKDMLDLRRCPLIPFVLGLVLKNMSECSVPLKIDPAVASDPLITTINDLVAVVTYYGLAWILLINVMGL